MMEMLMVRDRHGSSVGRVCRNRLILPSLSAIPSFVFGVLGVDLFVFFSSSVLYQFYGLEGRLVAGSHKWLRQNFGREDLLNKKKKNCSFKKKREDDRTSGLLPSPASTCG